MPTSQVPFTSCAQRPGSLALEVANVTCAPGARYMQCRVRIVKGECAAGTRASCAARVAGLIFTADAACTMALRSFRVGNAAAETPVAWAGNQVAVYSDAIAKAATAGEAAITLLVRCMHARALCSSDARCEPLRGGSTQSEPHNTSMRLPYAKGVRVWLSKEWSPSTVFVKQAC